MTEAAPFIKWVGGKRQLLPEIEKHIPLMFGRYFEPFVGGGALFFHLANRKPGLHSVIGDLNPFLVKTYRGVKDSPSIVCDFLRSFAITWGGYRDDAGRDRYYLGMREALGSRIAPDANEAARVIFLNKTCFNGLWRVNKRGRFNVPPGKFKALPNVYDPSTIHIASQSLQHASIWEGDYQTTCADATRGDFVYLDPPYIPVSASANFTAYAKQPFGPAQQRQLRDFAWSLKSGGVNVLLSNSDTPEVRELYKDFNMRQVSARRSVNRDATKRGPVGEMLIW